MLFYSIDIIIDLDLAVFLNLDLTVLLYLDLATILNLDLVYLSAEYRGYPPLYEDGEDPHQEGEDRGQQEAPPFPFLDIEE